MEETVCIISNSGIMMSNNVKKNADTTTSMSSNENPVEVYCVETNLLLLDMF